MMFRSWFGHTSLSLVSMLLLLPGCGDGDAVPTVPDAAPVVDASEPDASEPDANPPDASEPDANEPDARLAEQGEACSEDGACAAGHCVDGVCCESACIGTCVSCASAHTGGEDGLCAPVLTGTDPDEECGAQEPSSCGNAGLGCNGDATAPACVKFDAATQCAAARCEAGQASAASSCDGSGLCVAPTELDCAPYVCGATSCLTSCSVQTDCQTGHYCEAGACVPTLAPGSACGDTFMCNSGFCVDGVCCSSACAGSCEACSVAEGAVTDGTCAPTARGSVGKECSAAQLCDGTSNACVAACVDGSADLTRRPVDVIMIVDNSGSMTQEIQAIESTINSRFADVLGAAGLDYRVILIGRHGSASGAQSMCITAPLSGLASCSPVPARPVNGPRFFHYSTEIGSTNGWCRAIATYSTADEFSLSPTGWGAHLRSDAHKAFLAVSDDNNSGCTAANIMTQLYALPGGQFGTASAPNFEAHALVGVQARTPASLPWGPSDPLRTTTCGSSAVNTGTVHQSLAIATGGMRYPMCNTTAYGAIFEDLATHLIQTGCKYAIPAAPAGFSMDDPTVVTEFTASNGSPVVLRRVANAAACADGDYYVEGDDVVLCPASCSTVVADAGGDVRIRYLCN